MNLREPFISELRVEAGITRRMLERLPPGALPWKPHDKFRTLGEIAAHIAHLPGLFIATLNQDEFDRHEYASPARHRWGYPRHVRSECRKRIRSAEHAVRRPAPGTLALQVRRPRDLREATLRRRSHDGQEAHLEPGRRRGRTSARAWCRRRPGGPGPRAAACACPAGRCHHPPARRWRRSRSRRSSTRD